MSYSSVWYRLEKGKTQNKTASYSNKQNVTQKNRYNLSQQQKKNEKKKARMRKNDTCSQ